MLWISGENTEQNAKEIIRVLGNEKHNTNGILRISSKVQSKIAKAMLRNARRVQSNKCKGDAEEFVGECKEKCKGNTKDSSGNTKQNAKELLRVFR